MAQVGQQAPETAAAPKPRRNLFRRLLTAVWGLTRYLLRAARGGLWLWFKTLFTIRCWAVILAAVWIATGGRVKGLLRYDFWDSFLMFWLPVSLILSMMQVWVDEVAAWKKQNADLKKINEKLAEALKGFGKVFDHLYPDPEVFRGKDKT